jgi:hypothetical protein
MTETTLCAICEKPLSCVWSDTHGVGACFTCGLPYRLYHYENDTRVEKPPSVAVPDEWVVIGRKYWNETHRRTFPAAFDFVGGRNGRTYSGATQDEINEWETWLDAHKDELPKPETADESQTEQIR